jgi:hypothetical protein
MLLGSKTSAISWGEAGLRTPCTGRARYAVRALLLVILGGFAVEGAVKMEGRAFIFDLRHSIAFNQHALLGFSVKESITVCTVSYQPAENTVTSVASSRVLHFANPHFFQSCEDEHEHH